MPRRSSGGDPFSIGPIAAYSREHPDVAAEYVRSLDEISDEEGEDRSEDELAPRTRLVRSELYPRLFDYQEDLVKQAVALYSKEPPRNRGLLALPTGGGKTRTAVVAILRTLEGGSLKKVLWIAPTRELLSQAQRAFIDVWHAYGKAPDFEVLRCDRLGKFPNDTERAVYLATPQMLASRSQSRASDLVEADLLVFDEAHHLGAPTFRAAVEAYLSSASSPALLGLSATPGRSSEGETESLVQLFEGRLLRSDSLSPNAVRSLQRRGVLSKLAFKLIPGTESCRRSGGALSLATDEDRFRKTVDLITGIPKDQRILVFTASVAHAYALAAVLRAKGSTAEAVSGYLGNESRRSRLQAFESGAVQVLLNKALLVAGYDCPAVSHVVLTVPVGSSISFEQAVGRAARGPAVGGNKRATVWAVEDHLEMHGLPSSYYRFEDFDWT